MTHEDKQEVCDMYLGHLLGSSISSTSAILAKSLLSPSLNEDMKLQTVRAWYHIKLCFGETKLRTSRKDEMPGFSSEL